MKISASLRCRSRAFLARISLSFVALAALFCSLQVSFAQSQQGLFPPPANLTAEWVWPNGNPPAKVKLTWEQPEGTDGNSVYIIFRRLGSTDTASGWTQIHNGTVPNAAGSTTLRTITDNGLSTTSSLRYVFYRVRTRSSTAASATNTSGAAEVGIIGNPGQAQGGDSFDSDADGIPDQTEALYTNGHDGDQQNPLTTQDWADGSGDADGDGVPNAWECALSSTDPKHLAMYDADVTPAAHCTVNRSAPIDTTSWTKNYHTISAAIAGLPSQSTTYPSSYRIIRVSPGIYEENLSLSTSQAVAILPNRPTIDFSEAGHNHTLYDPKGEIEIRGTHATSPVVSIANSHVVMDGLIIGRKAGTAGTVVSITQTQAPTERIYLTRLVNCLFRNNNTGSSALIEQDRARLILSHCTFFMNAAANGALGTVLSTGAVTDSASFLFSTAETRIQNCVLWNPVNTNVPEYQSDGPLQFTTSIVHQRRSASGTLPDPVPGILPAGTEPHLTPLGYLVGPDYVEEEDPLNPGSLLPFWELTGAMGLGTPNLHVLRDMHGEWRSNEPDKIDLGAHQWRDADYDGIPNFADSLNPWNLAPDLAISDPEARLADWFARSAANISLDHDADGISERQEYLYGTDVNNADTYFLSIHQAVRMFAPLGGSGTGSSGLTLQEVLQSVYTKMEADTRFWRRTDTLRIPEAGDLSMGSYTSGPPLP